jgi:FRG domain
MSHYWTITQLTSTDHVLDVLARIHGKRWLSRGQPKRYDCLLPSIDRDGRAHVSRTEILQLERQSIDIFRSTARYFAASGERGALADDIVSLMVLRHYGVPTRLVDWSASPYVAAYFAACCYDDDGEIWCFDEPQYEQAGQKQWEKWPETTIDGSGEPSKFAAGLTAFTVEEPPDWFICAFYTGFPRQDAQAGAYTMTARFGRDHADAIARLLSDDSLYHLYIVPKAFKPTVHAVLREKHGVWRGSLFPDSAGAADTARKVFEMKSV